MSDDDKADKEIWRRAKQAWAELREEFDQLSPWEQLDQKVRQMMYRAIQKEIVSPVRRGRRAS